MYKQICNLIKIQREIFIKLDCPLRIMRKGEIHLKLVNTQKTNTFI